MEAISDLKVDAAADLSASEEEGERVDAVESEGEGRLIMLSVGCGKVR